MAIFNNKEIDIYKGKTRVLKTLRVDTPTAVKIDELQAVCTTIKGKTVSQNQILTGIINSFLLDIENLARDNEEKAVNKVLALLE